MADAENKKETEDETAEGAAAEGAEQKPGFDAKKIILFVVAPLVLLLGAGGGLYFTGMLDGLLGKKGAVAEGEAGHGEENGGEHGDEAAEDSGHGEEAAADAHGGGDGHGGKVSNFLEIPPMTVNLTNDDGTPTYLRLTVQLELKNQADKAAVEAVMPRVIDQFQTYLRELRVKDLRGSAGIYRLQMELLWRVNQAAAPVQVKDVLFQEILVQ